MSQTYAPPPRKNDETGEAAPVKGLSDERRAQLDTAKRVTDDLLDEIDAVLEETGNIAADFTQGNGQ